MKQTNLLTKNGRVAAAFPGTAVDPICGMEVEKVAALSAERDGQTFYFCSAGCRAKFRGQPAPTAEPTGPVVAKEPGHSCCGDGGAHRGSAAAAKPPTHVVTAGKYICPMHPQIEQDGPGDCPLCGMALEPKTVTASSGGAEDNTELTDMTRRLWVGAVLTLPVFLLAMAHLFPNAPGWLSGNAARWSQFVLATPVVLWAGWPFFVRGWRSLVNRHLNMFTLIALGVSTAYLYSAAVRPSRRWPTGWLAGLCPSSSPSRR